MAHFLKLSNRFAHATAASFTLAKLTNVNIDVILKSKIYNRSIFAFDPFEKRRNLELKSYNFEEIKKQFQTQLNTDNKKKVSPITSSQEYNRIKKNLTSLVFTCKDEQGLKFVRHTFKKHVTDLSLKDCLHFGAAYAKLCLILNSIDQLMEAFFDKELTHFFLGQFTTFMIMNELLIAQRHSECFTVFETYIRNIKSYQNAQNIELFIMASNVQQKKVLISFGQFRLACLSLLYLNTPEAFNKMKYIISTNLLESNVYLNDKILVSCFLLALRQNEFEYGLALAFNFELNRTLKANLISIANCRLNRIDRAFKAFEFMFIDNDFKNIAVNPNSLNKQVFPFTIECLKKGIEANSLMLSKNQLSTYKEFMLTLEENVYKMDIFDYCFK